MEKGFKMSNTGHHHHSPEFSKKASNRLSKAIGHLGKVKKMVEEEKDCVEVLTQLLAVKAALDSTGKYILKEHMTHCIYDAVKEGDYKGVADLEKLIDSYLK